MTFLAGEEAIDLEVLGDKSYISGERDDVTSGCQGREYARVVKLLTQSFIIFLCKHHQNFVKRISVFGRTFMKNLLHFMGSYSECGSKCVFLTKEKRVVHMKK